MPRVLLIEPNDELRRVFRRRFSREGFELVEANDAEEGLGAARSGQPDVIVVEGWVRDAVGVEVTCRIATDPELRGVPVIVLATRPRWEATASAATGQAPVTGNGAADPERGGEADDGHAPGAPWLRELQHPFCPGILVELAKGAVRAGRASEPLG